MVPNLFPASPSENQTIAMAENSPPQRFTSSIFDVPNEKNKDEKTVNAEQRDLNLASNPYLSPIIDVAVGPTKYIFRLHSQVLRRVPFFRCCLDSKFGEAKNQRVELPEDDPEVFGEIVKGLYGDQLISPFSGSLFSTTNPISEPFKTQHTLRLLAKAYVLADKLRADNIQDKIIAIFYVYHQTYLVDPETISLMGGLPDSRLRKFLVQEFVYSLKTRPWAELIKEDPSYAKYQARGGADVPYLLQNIIDCFQKEFQRPTATPLTSWQTTWESQLGANLSRLKPQSSSRTIFS